MVSLYRRKQLNPSHLCHPLLEANAVTGLVAKDSGVSFAFGLMTSLDASRSPQRYVVMIAPDFGPTLRYSTQGRQNIGREFSCIDTS